MSLAASDFFFFFFFLYIYIVRKKQAENDVTTFFNLRFITTQKPTLMFEKILHANELQVKKVSLKVPDVLWNLVFSRTWSLSFQKIFVVPKIF